jgi:ABC-type proline/glycine betaine transport system ATPase subunit
VAEPDGTIGENPLDAPAPRAMIELKEVTKYYPGSDIPAVAELTLDIPEGEILVLVGPSGCGKSTTLRLINRMIEPTSGRIIFDGEDVTRVNADQLRRRIGYVIQQIGLFPHQTIAQNIATVPRMQRVGQGSHRRTRRRAARARGHGPQDLPEPLSARSSPVVRRSVSASLERSGPTRRSC